MYSNDARVPSTVRKYCYCTALVQDSTTGTGLSVPVHFPRMRSVVIFSWAFGRRLHILYKKGAFLMFHTFVQAHLLSHVPHVQTECEVWYQISSMNKVRYIHVRKTIKLFNQERMFAF